MTSNGIGEDLQRIIHWGGAPYARPCTGAHWEQGEGWEPAGWGSHATCEPLPHVTCGLGKLGDKLGSPTSVNQMNTAANQDEYPSLSSLYRSPWVCHHLSILRRHLSW